MYFLTWIGLELANDRRNAELDNLFAANGALHSNLGYLEAPSRQLEALKEHVTLVSVLGKAIGCQSSFLVYEKNFWLDADAITERPQSD